MTRATVVLVWLIGLASSAICHECGSLDIRNTVRQFEVLRNCTKINGSLQVVLINIPAGYNESFPELVEITHYLMFYRVYGLRSLGDLFPNLAIIRGQELFINYALIIYEMKDLEEVGLYSLSRFRRGSARIDKNANLCYLNTINWEVIGGSHHFITENRNVSECPNKCPKHCPIKNCWNQDHCQIVLPAECSRECVKGCTGPRNDQCEFCENLEDNGKCVSKCSSNTYHLINTNKCVSRKECLALSADWWIFNGECLNKCPPKYERVPAALGHCRYCGSGCPKVCNGSNVTTLASIQELKECTFINGSLRINCPANIEDELEENLGRIEEITGFLKVYRSFSIRSLGFLKSLKVIHGRQLDSKYYSLVVHENQNLQSLWDWRNATHRLRVLNGTFSFHYNPKLCMSEIERLANVSGLRTAFTQVDVSPHSNGDKFPCRHVNLSVTVAWRDTDAVTLQWDASAGQQGQALVGFLVHYIEAPARNVTMFHGDACDDEKWRTIFVSHGDKSPSVVRQNVTQLRPYTQYAFYISTSYDTGSGGQSPLHYFTTLSGDPHNPTDIEARPEGSDAIALSWQPPAVLNGVLSHYIIVAYQQRDNRTFLDQRDFCRLPRQHEPHAPEPSTPRPPATFTAPPAAGARANVSSAGARAACCDKGPLVSLRGHQDFDKICSDLDRYANSATGSCGHYAYGIIQDVMDGGAASQRRRRSNDIIKVVDAASTSTLIAGLDHYTIYVFLVRACNQNRTQEHQCSSVMMLSQRTGRRDAADDIPHLAVSVADVHTVQLEWPEPPDPNAVIVSYNVEYRSADASSDKTVSACVTRREHQAAGHTYKFTNFVAGAYRVRVRANSLAGSGRFTPYQRFVISVSPQTSVTVPAATAAVCVLAALAAALLYLRRRRRRQLDNIRLIARVNPEYAGYVEDEWEIERANVEVHDELGQGTFGTVYSGLLRSKGVACAVKTVHAHATMHDKMEFLNEASVMKSFNDAHHVIRLLGVVSRGQQPLVVMELMARGDLKTYLRSTRESSTNLTCCEMYRMAAEVADGMAYLSAKKFVHRDLAARNCMVASDRTVKVGDFGMTRDVYETDYYRKETRGLLPVRWMAPESLADGVFTSDSDIWSYGIVLWEVATLAEQPYQGLSNEQVLQFVVSKGVLERPQQCPDVLYDIMEVCWKWRPTDRPTFMEIVERLEASVGQDFRLVSFYHSREGEELRLHRYDLNRIRASAAVPMHRLQQVLPPVRWNKGDEQVSSYSSYPFLPKHN